MLNFRYFYIILLLAPLGCAPIDVVYQHDPNADFKNLKTFKLLPTTQKDIKNTQLSMDRGDFDRALDNAFSSTLTKKGYRLDVENPDFVVSYYVIITTSRTVIPGKTYYRNIGYSYTGTLVTDVHHTDKSIVSYRLGSLNVEIFDEKTKKSIWRGTAKTAVGLNDKTEEQVKRINTVVQKILKKFPPD
ncbi:MAG: DUF4136 domain-containing protein [Thiohalomonadales bacterium]